eukprot:scaffold81257_cov58-Phaeocystis_antarctica.AAC.4
MTTEGPGSGYQVVWGAHCGSARCRRLECSLLSVEVRSVNALKGKVRHVLGRRTSLDRGSGLRAGVSKCITAASSSAAPPALLVMWVVVAEVVQSRTRGKDRRSSCTFSCRRRCRTRSPTSRSSCTNTCRS